MNDLQIDYFMAVATNLSFTKTSEELYVSQPAISKQIALLEKELDVRLFARSNKKTELTEAGKLYYDFFSKYKADFRNVKREAERFRSGKKELLRVGFLEGWDLSPFLPGALQAFSALHPEIEVVINCCGVKELSTLLLTDSLDVIMTLQNSVVEIGEIESSAVAEVGKLILFSAKHPLAENEDLRPEMFKDDVFYAPWGIIDTMVIRLLNSYLHPYGIKPEVRFVQNHESMITCVRNNMGVAVCDRWVWAKHAQDLRFLPIKAKDTVCVSLMKNNNNRAAYDFAEALKTSGV